MWIAPPPCAPSLLEFLGDMAWYIDCLVDRRAGGAEVVGGVQKWTMEANWKFASEARKLQFVPLLSSVVIRYV